MARYGIRYSDVVKARAVKLAGKIGQAKAAAKIGCTTGILRKWMADSETKAGRKVNTQNILPTVVRRKQRRSKQLIATGYRCPHCDGLIEMKNVQ